MVKQEPKEEKLNLEEGSTEITLKDIYVLFYILVKQSQKLHPGSKMSFDLRVFKNLPKKIKVHFERKHGRLFAWIPSKLKERKKKSNIILIGGKVITPN